MAVPKQYRRRKGVKVSVNSYQEKALEWVQQEYGLAPATTLYKFAMSMNDPNVLEIKHRFDYFVEYLRREEYANKNNQQEQLKVPFGVSNAADQFRAIA